MVGGKFEFRLFVLLIQHQRQSLPKRRTKLESSVHPNPTTQQISKLIVGVRTSECNGQQTTPNGCGGGNRFVKGGFKNLTVKAIN